MTAMNALPVSAGQMGWVSVLVFGFPVAMVLLGEAIRHLQRRRHPILPAVAILRSWVLPSLTLQVLLTRVVGVARTAVSVRVAETLFWISVIVGALSLLNGILFEGAPQGSWQAKVPQLIRDLGRFILVLLGSSIVLSTVWGADLGGFLTALGVGSLVLGLALQDSLGNIFSGVALLFEQPIRLGDWVDINGKNGEVVEVNWRAVHLMTTDNNLVVVPNSELGKTSFTNLSRPDRHYIQSVHISFSLEDPPNLVKEVMEAAAMDIEGVLKIPAPKAELASYNDHSICYKLEFCCPNYGAAGGMADAFLRRIWYVARREGLTIPYPVQRSLPYAQPPEHLPENRRQRSLRGLRESLFAMLPEVELQELARTCPTESYGAGEVVISQGQALTALHLILDGQAEVFWIPPGGVAVTLGLLGRGDCFGERVNLLHQRIANCAVRAVTDLGVMRISAETLASITDRQPRLAAELTDLRSWRQQAIESLQLVGSEATDPAGAKGQGG